jgi:3-hydroxyisobutyrate dehydrogenase
MRLASLALEELTEALNRGWGQRDSRVSGLLQVERSGIPTPNVDPAKVQAVLDSDRQT